MQWYLPRCRALDAWNASTGANVVVAAADWGVLLSHQEFMGRIDPNRLHNSITGTNDVGQGEGKWHGTAVLGLVGAGLNADGMVGFAPDASMWSIQAGVESATQAALTPDHNSWASAIEWVRGQPVDEGVRKVLLVEAQTGALGNIEAIPCVAEAIRDAIADNVVVCVAAGNGGMPVDQGTGGVMPSATGSILVGATVFDDCPKRNPRWPDSNFGEQITVWAPGDGMFDLTCSADEDELYTHTFGGTSGAAAKVAGAVALMLGANSKLEHFQIREILRKLRSRTTEDESGTTGAFLDAWEAVDKALDAR
jgi:subtilisin family serine protease